MDERELDALFARYVEHLVVNSAHLDIDELAGGNPEVAAGLKDRIEAFQQVGEALESRSRPLTGRTLSRYRIHEKLGAGGMGDVYRASDLQLVRDVAIKVLPPAFALQPERRSRFEREARIMAALGHPNIAAIHGVESAEGVQFLVLELVAGETLAETIRRGPLPLDHALPILKQIGDALEVAHGKGIVHRDLKPANVMVTPSGRVKVLDFGLGKTLLPPPGEESHPDTTATGVILGTASYMSPEQARGREVDRRTDVWSFGCVFYETLTGRKAFPGTNFTETLAAILEREPDWTALPHETPDSIRILLRRCLEKSVERRLRDLGDAGIEIQDALEPPRETRSTNSDSWSSGSETELPTLPSIRLGATRFPLLSRKRLLSAAAALVALGGIIAAAVALVGRNVTPPAALPARHQQLTFVGNADIPAITPDGKFIAYVTRETGPHRVMVQEIDGGQAIQIFEASYIWDVRWSPDGSRLLVYGVVNGERGTFLVPRLGGTPVPFGDRPRPAWSPDGARFASYAHGKSLTLTDRSTGDETTVPLSLPSFEPSPGPVPPTVGMDWSPTGALFAFVVYGSETVALWTVGVTGGDSVKITEDAADLASPRFSPAADAIYYLRNAGQTWELWKAPISADSGRPDGAPRFLVGGLESGYFFTLSADAKRFLYTRRGSSSHLWLARLSANGIETRQLTTGTVNDGMPSLSPEGNRVAFSRENGEASNIFVADVDGGPPTQLTFFQSHNDVPVWSPDGEEIAFASEEGGVHRVWTVRASGGTPRLIADTDLGMPVWLAWSPSREILYKDGENKNLVRVDPVSGEKSSLPRDGSDQSLAAFFSSDGKRIALWHATGPSATALSILENDHVVKVWDDPFFPLGWASDGAGIYDLDSAGGHQRIVLLPLDGSDRKVATELPFDGMVSYGHTTPDGGFVFGVTHFQSDVWLMENFDPSIR